MTMASATNTTNTTSNAALFGEDDDSDDSSSDESVVANADAAAADNEKDPTGDDVASPAASAAAADESEQTTTANTPTTDSADADNVAAGTAPATKKNVDNSALFGDDDDDDSSEDGEFDGGDDIVGRSAGRATAGASSKGVQQPVVERSMNQRLGLDSDSDDENLPTKPTSEGGEEVDGPKKPMYLPPRRMELTNLPGIHDSTIPTLPNSNNQQPPIYFITKLPNLVAINPEPYNVTTFDAQKEEEQYRGYVHNMIRWRYKCDSSGEIARDATGNPIRESNTRLVKWSDGSYTLHIGTEVLEVDNLDSSIPADHPDESMAGFPGINGYLYVSQQASIRPPSKKALEKGPPDGEDDNTNDDDDDDDDVPPQSAGTVLECIAPITSRLSCRPASLASEAHRSHTLAVRQRNLKRARIAEIVTEVDPEKEKLARIKGKDDMEKIRARGGGARRSTGGGGGAVGRSRRGMNESYLEADDEDDYDGVNISRLKKQTLRKDNSDEDEMDYGDDDDDSEDDAEDWMSKKKQTRGAAAARAAKGEKKTSAATSSSKYDMESSEEGEVVFGDDDDDDDEDDAAFVKKRGGGRGGVSSKAVLSDDDDE